MSNESTGAGSERTEHGLAESVKFAHAPTLQYLVELGWSPESATFACEHWLSGSNLVTAESARDLALQNLQGLTEAAVSSREQQTELRVALLVPAVRLAQQVAAQLHAYGFANQILYAKTAADDWSHNCYWVEELEWSTGPWYRRRVRSAAVLISGRHPNKLLWDPRTSDINWDLESPPLLTCFQAHKPADTAGSAMRPQCTSLRLADTATLVKWSHEALSLLERLKKREDKRVSFISGGVEASAAALSRLDI